MPIRGGNRASSRADQSNDGTGEVPSASRTADLDSGEPTRVVGTGAAERTTAQELGNHIIAGIRGHPTAAQRAQPVKATHFSG